MLVNAYSGGRSNDRMSSDRVSLRAFMIPACTLGSLFAFATVTPEPAAAQTVGVASWYGGKHDGRRTSSGETFDQEGLTAASRSIPLGTRVRVTMHETGQSVVVMVNDRMGGRAAIIDLSKGAARQIGLLGRGRGMVSIALANDEPLEVAEAPEDDSAADDAIAAPRGRQHRRRAGRSVAAAHRCCHVPSVILARHSVQHRAIQRRL